MKKHFSRKISWLLIIVANVLEGLFAWLVLVHAGWFHFLLAAVHCAAVLLFRYGMRMRRTEIQGEQFDVEIGILDPEAVNPPTAVREEDVWTRLSLPVGLFLPFFGIGGLTVLTILLPFEKPGHGAIFDEYREYIRYRKERPTFFKAIDIPQATLEKLSVEPIVDLLAGRDKNTVWGSVEVLSRLADQGAVGLIKKTMEDRDMDVKFYSSWGLERIEERFKERLDLLCEKLNREMTRESVFEYARTMVEYVRSDLVEEVLLDGQVRKTLTWIDRFLKKEPAEGEVMILKAILLRHQGLLKDSVGLCRNVIAEKRLTPRFVPDVAEIFFCAGDYQTVTELMDEFTRAESNQEFLDGRVVETDLTALRTFWIPASTGASTA